MPLFLSPEQAAPFRDHHTEPGPHLDLLAAASFRVAGAGMRLGVFDALAEAPATAAALAGRLEVDPRGLGQLLETLASFGYVRHGEHGYTNTPQGGEWLRSGGYATAFSFWHTVLTELWDELERSVRDGAPAVDFYQWLARRPAALRQFQTLLSGMAARLAPEVLALVPPPAGGGHLLDLGGGHAGYAITFCQRYPELRATVVDLPAALTVGKEAVEAAGLTDRITLCPGDLQTAPLAPDASLVLLFNLVHGLGPTEIPALLESVAGALRPGGTVVLLEPLADQLESAGPAGEAFVRMFSLHLFHSQGGQVYHYRELTQWLRRAGFAEVRRQALPGSPTDQLVIATRS